MSRLLGSQLVITAIESIPTLITVVHRCKITRPGDPQCIDVFGTHPHAAWPGTSVLRAPPVQHRFGSDIFQTANESTAKPGEWLTANAICMCAMPVYDDTKEDLGLYKEHR